MKVNAYPLERVNEAIDDLRFARILLSLVDTDD